MDDGYELNMHSLLLHSLSKACKLQNDRVHVRHPIKTGLLEMLLFEMERIFHKQYYLETLYKTIFLLGYYSLLRIREMAYSPHVLRAKNMNIGKNKNKLLLVLYSSKTHHLELRPQQIKISEVAQRKNLLSALFK